MKTIRYDFSKFDSIMHRIKEDPSSNNMRALQKELNSFFKDSNCNGVIYTENTDKLFFGMCVMPNINGFEAKNIIQTDDRIRISSYYLELDSKLFDPMLGLTSQELTAVLLHEVGHLVNDNSPVEELRKEIDVYLAKENETLVMSDSIHYSEILAYGIKDYLRRAGSLFEKKDDELIADEFVYHCGYGKQLESAFKKIVKSNKLLNKDVSNKFLVLRWTLLLYKDVKHRRIAALKVLNKGKSLDSSKLETREKENVIRRLNRIDDDSLLEATILEFKSKNNIYSNMKNKGIKYYENDILELKIRIKTVETEAQALDILREINRKISIVDEIIRTEDLTEKEKERCFDILESYNDLRTKLLKKDVVKTKGLPIKIDYEFKKHGKDKYRSFKLNEEFLLDEATEFKAKKGIFSNMRSKGAKALEDELFEFAIRLKTLNTEEDALVMLRQVNYRISLIDEYIRTENLTEEEKQRWYDLMDSYNNIRMKIVEKDIGKTKAYGLWIAYPDKER